MSSEDAASYKLLFSAPKVVRDLVLGFIPDQWLHSLDYTTLEKVPGSYVTDDLICVGDPGRLNSSSLTKYQMRYKITK